MSEQLREDGFLKGYFPFDDQEIEYLKSVANQASELTLERQKNIFKEFSKLKELFKRAIMESGLDIELTEYCFYIEKSDKRNWPLLMHRDINMPKYLDMPNEPKEQFLKDAVMFRLTLDHSDKDTGAIKVIPGSHTKKASKEVFLNTEEGEVIFFKPLLLHGSNKMKRAHKRRVFQALCSKKRL